MPRYTILTHDHPFEHWDFLLDPGEEGLLRTWRILKTPDESGAIPAQLQPDHRRIYLDYSGPISGNRGSVAIWDQGEYELVGGAELLGESMRMECRGRRLSGEIRLQRVRESEWEYSYLGDSETV